MRRATILHALIAIAGFGVGATLVLLVLSIAAHRAPERALPFSEMYDLTGTPADAGSPTTVSVAVPAERNALRDSEPPRTESASLTIDSLAVLVDVLRGHDLEMPIPGIDREDLYDDFDDPRPDGRTHGALDIAAPRNSPVVAVDDGSIASLDLSQGGGGIVIYQYDPTGEFVYYYAHLERHADGLHVEQTVRRGEVIGYVGTSGNAPPDVPHLHFAIYKTTPGNRWWRGIPINPYAILH